MSNCPCRKCITYAICHKSPSIKTLIDKCTIINDYITSRYRAAKVVRIIEPQWYTKPREGEPLMSEGARNIFNYAHEITKHSKKTKKHLKKIRKAKENS